jgi:ATP-dependent RNA helicase DeaD
LNVGFLDDIKLIFSCMVHEHLTVMFSATMPEAIKLLAHDCMRDPAHITLIQERCAPVSISHCFAYVSPNDKYAAFLEFAKHENVDQMLIFCNARHQVDKLHKTMCKDLHGVEFVHAGLVQEKRTTLFRHLREGKIKYLIATDVAGRGLDFSRISHVVNWDMPWDAEQYTHRTGRTGRMSRKGKAMTLITQRDLNALDKLIRDQQITPTWLGANPLAEGAPKSAAKAHRRPHHSAAPHPTV